MTINTNNTRNEYVASGGQTTFSYTFRIFDETDLDVYQTASGDTPADGDIITAYTVTGVGTVGGGTIVLDTGATANDKITIVYNPSLSRSVDYVTNGDFSPAAVNEDIDTNTNFIKRLYSMLRRIPKFSEAQQTVNDLTMQAPVAGEFLRWKSDASGIESISLNTATAGSNAAAITYSNGTSGLTATDVQAAIDELENEIDALSLDPQDTADLITLSGVAANSTSLGTFTGTTIPDSRTIKQALQALETKVEAVESAATPFWTLISSATPSAANIYELVLDTATYKCFKLEFFGIAPSADDPLRLVVATGAPATYQTGGTDYVYVNSSKVGDEKGDAAYHPLCDFDAAEKSVESTAAMHGSLEFNFVHLASANGGLDGVVSFTDSGGVKRTGHVTCGFNFTPAALTKVKLYWATGAVNFAAQGTIRLYGRA